MLLGQEIFNFFNRHGEMGFFGLIISMGILGFTCYKTLNYILKTNPKDYNEMIDNVTNYNKTYAIPIKVLVKIFLLVSFYIMEAGLATYFFQEMEIPKILGGILVAILSIITFSMGIDGVIKINKYLIPILIFLTISLGIKNNIALKVLDQRLGINFKWLKDSILYASYNSIVLVPILIGLKKHIKSKKQNIFILIIVTLLMTLMGIILYFVLNKFKYEIVNVEIPTVYIASKFGNSYKYLYGITILIGIFTSAISAGYGFLINYGYDKHKYFVASILICVLSIVISNFSFATLISILYPVFGYLGLIQLFFLFIY